MNNVVKILSPSGLTKQTQIATHFSSKCKRGALIAHSRMFYLLEEYIPYALVTTGYQYEKYTKMNWSSVPMHATCRISCKTISQ